MASEELKDWQQRLAQVALDIKLKTLPFDIPWDYFEELCLKLAIEERNFGDIEVTDAMIYGRSGQKQEGIDVKGTIPNSEKFFVMQCKRYKRITSGDITKWVNDFIKGKFSNQTSLYILATTFDISSDIKLVDSWHEAQQKLDKLGIKSAIWDKKTILAKLKNTFEITSIYWGEKIASKYCHKNIPEELYPYSYTIKNINSLGGIIQIENNTSQLELFVPNKTRGIKSGGIFSFARKDLHGTTFSIDGCSLVPLLQTKANSRSLKDTDYLYKSDKKYFLSLANIRLTLEENEVDDLDWILDQAFSYYLKHCKKIEEQLKAKRFERTTSPDFKVKLCEIKRNLWNAIIEYAYEHDISNGTGDEFIYDSVPGCLKVFVDKKKNNLDYGYHLIIYPKLSNSVLNDNVILEWAPLEDIITGGIAEISQRKAWDAEFTYHWLHTYLFPKVYNWENNKGKGESKRSFFGSIFRKKNEENIYPLSYFISSSYVATSRNIGGGANSLKSVQNYTDKLQRHFYCYQRQATIKKQLIISVIDACIFLLNKNTELRCDYIKGNLHLGGETTLKELILLKEDKESRVYATSTMLEMALRSLGKLLELKHELSQYEIDSLNDYLSPVFDRYEEDRICITYT